MAIATMNHDRYRSITSFWEHQISSILVEYLNLSSLHFLSFPASSLAPSSCEGINEQNWSNEWKLWTSVNGNTKHLQMHQFQCPRRDLPDHCHQRPGASWYNWCTWSMALLGSARCVSGCRMYSLPFNMICLVRIMWFLSATAAKNMRVPIAFLAFLGQLVWTG